MKAGSSKLCRDVTVSLSVGRPSHATRLDSPPLIAPLILHRMDSLMKQFDSSINYSNIINKYRDKWVPVTTAWRVLRLRMEERPPIWRVAANILNKQSRTEDKRWYSSLGFGRDANNSSP